jgi:hypothetical protein
LQAQEFTIICPKTAHIALIHTDTSLIPLEAHCKLGWGMVMKEGLRMDNGGGGREGREGISRRKRRKNLEELVSIYEMLMKNQYTHNF